MNRFLKMNRFFKSCLLASAGLVMLAITLSFTTPGRAFAQRVGEDCVRICDTASNPLHVIVQGITRVTGDVRINNENAIATTVTGPVQVTTSPREPLYVIERLKVDNIFQEQVSLTLKGGDIEEIQDFVVPAGKFLEIKSGAGTAMFKTNNQNLWIPHFVNIVVIRPSNGTQYFYPLSPGGQGEFAVVNGVPTRTFQIGGEELFIFALPGDTVRVKFLRYALNTSIETKLELTISGKYNDL